MKKTHSKVALVACGLGIALAGCTNRQGTNYDASMSRDDSTASGLNRSQGQPAEGQDNATSSNGGSQPGQQPGSTPSPDPRMGANGNLNGTGSNASTTGSGDAQTLSGSAGRAVSPNPGLGGTAGGTAGDPSMSQGNGGDYRVNDQFGKNTGNGGSQTGSNAGMGGNSSNR